eukprot:1146948-Pelagomonas_calceolata.AAC.1
MARLVKFVRILHRVGMELSCKLAGCVVAVRLLAGQLFSREVPKVLEPWVLSCFPRWYPACVMDSPTVELSRAETWSPVTRPGQKMLNYWKSSSRALCNSNKKKRRTTEAERILPTSIKEKGTHWLKRAVTLHTSLLGVYGVIYTLHTLEPLKELGLNTHTAIKLALKLHAHSVQYAYKVISTRRTLEKTYFNSHHRN